MRTVLGVAFWLAVLALPAIMFLNPSVSVSFSQSEVQEIIEARLPFAGSKNGIEFQIPQGVEVDFREDGKIAIATDIVAKPALTKESRFEGHLIASARLVYEDRAFYAREIQPEQINGQTILSDRAKAATSIIGKAARAVGDATGITSEDVQSLLGIGDITEEAPRFLTDKLERLPLYEMSRAPYWVQLASGALETVAVEDQTLVAEIGLGTLVTNTLMIIAGLFILVILVATIFNGGMTSFIGLLLLGLFDKEC